MTKQFWKCFLSMILILAILGDSLAEEASEVSTPAPGKSGFLGFVRKLMRPMEGVEYLPETSFSIEFTPFVHTRRYEPLAVMPAGYLENHIIDRVHNGFAMELNFSYSQPTPLADINFRVNRVIENGNVINAGIQPGVNFNRSQSEVNLYLSRKFTFTRNINLEPLCGISIDDESITSFIAYQDINDVTVNSENELWNASGLIVGFNAEIGDFSLNMTRYFQGGAENYSFRDVSGDLGMGRFRFAVDFEPKPLTGKHYLLKDVRIRVFGDIIERVLTGNGYLPSGVYGSNRSVHSWMEYGFCIEKSLTELLSVNAVVLGTVPRGSSLDYTGMKEYHKEKALRVGIGVGLRCDFAEVDYEKIREFLRGSKKKIFQEEVGLFDRRNDNPVKRHIAGVKAARRLESLGSKAISVMAVVATAEGGVDVRRKGTDTWRRIVPGGYVFEGDSMITAEGANASVMLTDGSMVKVNESTEIGFEKTSAEQGGRNRLNLVIGEVFPEVIPGIKLKPDLEIRTPASTVRTKSARFNISVDLSGKTILNVKEGDAAMQNEYGKSEVGPNTGAYVKSGSEPESYKSVDWTKVDAWIEKAKIPVEARIEVEEFAKLIPRDENVRKIKKVMRDNNILYEEKVPSRREIKKKSNKLAKKMRKVKRKFKEVEKRIRDMKVDKSRIISNMDYWKSKKDDFIKNFGGDFSESVMGLSDITTRIRDELLVFQLEFDMSKMKSINFDSKVMGIRGMSVDKLENSLKAWETNFKLDLEGMDELIGNKLEALFMDVERMKDELSQMMDSFKTALEEAQRVNNEMEAIEMKSSVMGIAMEKARLNEKQLTITITEEVIKFETNRADIGEQYFPMLNRIANVLKMLSNYKVMVEGHTDSIGSKKYNMELSLKRASNMVEYFVKKYGMPKDMFVPMGYGEDRPKSSNKTKDGRAENRRVEIVLIKE